MRRRAFRMWKMYSVGFIAINLFSPSLPEMSSALTYSLIPSSFFLYVRPQGGENILFLHALYQTKYVCG